MPAPGAQRQDVLYENAKHSTDTARRSRRGASKASGTLRRLREAEDTLDAIRSGHVDLTDHKRNQEMLAAERLTSQVVDQATEAAQVA